MPIRGGGSRNGSSCVESIEINEAVNANVNEKINWKVDWLTPNFSKTLKAPKILAYFHS